MFVALPPKDLSKVKAEIRTLLSGYRAYPFLLGLALSSGPSPSQATLDNLSIVDKSSGHRVVVSGQTIHRHAQVLRANQVPFAAHELEPLKEFIRE